MFKAIQYDATFTVRKRKKYTPEFEAIHEFNGSTYKNVAFEYDTEREAINARVVLHRYVREAKMGLTVRQTNRKFVVVEKEM